MNNDERLRMELAVVTSQVIAEEMGISETEVRDRMRNTDFSKYIQMAEANTDKSDFYNTPTTPTKPTEPESNKPEFLKPDGSIDHAKTKAGDRGKVTIGDAPMDAEIVNKIGMEYQVKTPDGKLIKIKQDDFESEPSLDIGSELKKGYELGKQTRVRVNNSKEYDAELARLKELAGIKETASGGATGAGAIAGAPSIVGNTTHRPTDKLRANLRRKKLKKKKTK